MSIADRSLLRPRGASTDVRLQGPVNWLVAYVLLLFVLPARLVFAPLGGVGQPALLLGILIVVAWLVAKLTGGAEIHTDPHPLRWAIALFAAVLVTNYVVLQLRAQTPLEGSSSTRQLLIHLTVLGVAVACFDGLPTRAHLDKVVRAVGAGAVVSALVGYVQFFLGVDLPAFLALPGLDYSTPFGGVLERADLNRPAGTTLHPIEFGVVMGACVPLLIHLARFGRPAARQGWAVATMLVAGASMLSVSRSGILAAVAAVGTLAFAWNWRERLNAAVLGIGLVGVAWLTVPGLIGTFRFLFRSIETDPSAQARVERFPIAFETTMERPLLGRGLGTYTVEEGALLDQQLYQSAIELGLVGLAATVLLLAFTVGLGVATYVHPRASVVDRHLCAALLGSLAALMVTAVTYTAFWYRIHLSLLFLVVGLVGALWRLVVVAGPSRGVRP